MRLRSSTGCLSKFCPLSPTFDPAFGVNSAVGERAGVREPCTTDMLVHRTRLTVETVRHTAPVLCECPRFNTTSIDLFMPLQISIRVPTSEINGIRDRLQQSIAAARSQLVQSATEAALTDIIQSVPVETGETKNEWEAELSRIEATLPSSSTADLSLQSASNRIEQMVYIEYGTAHMRPRSIVGSAFARLQARLSSLFRWAN